MKNDDEGSRFSGSGLPRVARGVQRLGSFLGRPSLLRARTHSWPVAFLLAFLLSLGSIPARAAEPFVIAKGGQAVASLVLLPGSGKMAEQAAGDLAATLKTMTGAAFEIGSEPQKSPCVIVGLASEWAKLAKDEAPLKRLEGAAPESFLLLSTPTRLLVLGKDSNGASHGVYTLLRDLGCRWYFITKDWEVIPRLMEVAVTADRVEGPAMKVRILSNGAGAGASGRALETWCRRNRLGSAYGPQAVSHSYAGYVPKALFKEHPEYFAWVSKEGEAKGTEQNGEQPCTTHPEVVKMFKEGALAHLRKKKELTGEEPPLISISPNDGTPNMCRCDRCLATGTYGDCALLLANQVAETIHAEFPRTLVGFLAYGRAGAPPVNIKQAHPNVLASVAAGFNWKTSVPRLIEEWPKIARHVTVYEYYAIGAWGSQAPDNTQPTVEYISQTLRSWHAKGIEGINGEMENDWASCGHRLWAFAEFAWNPALAPDAAMNDFFAKGWGEAAAPMKRYYERWESGQKATPRVLRLAFQDLEEASRLAKSPEIARRVDQISLYLNWYLLSREFKATKDEEVRNQVALEGDLLQYRWRDSFMVQMIPAIFHVDRSAKIGFAPAEVAALRAAALQRFLPASGPVVDVGGGVSSMDLVPLGDFQNLKPLAGREREEGFLTTASYLFRAKAGESVTVNFELEAPAPSQGRAASRDPAPDEKATGPRDAAAPEAEAEKLGRLQLWGLGADGRDQEFIIEQNPTVPKDPTLRFEFKAPKDGLYRLNVRIMKGGARASFGARPHAIEARIKDRKNTLRLDKSSDPASSAGGRAAGATSWHFYVPKGTRAFVIEASSPGRKQVNVSLETGGGGTLKDETVDTGAELLVQVPAGKDGAVWTVRLGANRGQFGLAGVPPFVATHPEHLLVPREAVAPPSR